VAIEGRVVREGQAPGHELQVLGEDLREGRLPGDVLVADPVHLRGVRRDGTTGIDEPPLARHHLSAAKDHTAELDDAVDGGVTPGRFGIDRDERDVRHQVLAAPFLGEPLDDDLDEVRDARVMAAGAEAPAAIHGSLHRGAPAGAAAFSGAAVRGAPEVPSAGAGAGAFGAAPSGEGAGWVGCWGAGLPASAGAGLPASAGAGLPASVGAAP